MDRENDFGGWASLVDQRLAEDEALVRRYAEGEGRGQDMGPVRDFVRKVRGDLGARAIIASVKMNVSASGHEVIAGYYFPGESDAPAAAAEAAEFGIGEIPTLSGAVARAARAPLPMGNVGAPASQPGDAQPGMSREPLHPATRRWRGTPMRRAAPLAQAVPLLPAVPHETARPDEATA